MARNSRGVAKRVLMALAVAGAVLGSGAAFAQVHQVDMNNPLDANPQVGAGGSNKPVQGYVPINGNDVMTGNVSGLKYFHGQVGRPGGGTGIGTFSPYVLNTNQGTSQIGNFGRLTAGGVGVNGAVNQAYFLPSNTVSTAGGSLYYSPIGNGLDSALVPANVVSPSATNRLDLLAPNQQAYGTAYGGLDRSTAQPVNPGDQGAILQDPLFWERTKAALLAQQQANQAAAQAMQNPTVPTATMPSLEGGPTTMPVNPDEVQGAVLGGVGKPISGEPNEVKHADIGGKGMNAAVSLSSAKLIAQLDQAADTGATGEDNGEGGGQNGLAGGQGGQGNTNGLYKATGTDIALDPLTGNNRQIKLANRGGTGAGAGNTASNNGNSGTGGVGRGMVASAMPNGNQGMPGGSMGGGTATEPGEVNPYGPSNSTGSNPSVSAKRLQGASDAQLQAGSRLNPVKLAPDSLTTEGGASMFDAMMSRGDLDLRQGKYLDAAQAFQTAMANKPDDPLAVVGRAHAELGAGMYRAAAFDLKFVYTRKPELMSVKYDVGSFIPANRQAFLLQDLKKLTGDKDAGDMASFLYSYLCYQTGRTDLLQGELKDWGAAPGHDQWQNVATRSWGAVAKQK